MDGIGGAFASFSWVYLIGAGYTIYQLSRGWKGLWGPRAGSSTRQLAAMIAFFLLVPVGVLLHELGHMLAAQALGLEVFGLHYFLYWGYVVHASGTDFQNWIVSLAGNFASYALGVACLYFSMTLKPHRPAVNIILAQLGILEIVQTLIAYPLMSLDPTFHGDWDTIYSLDVPVPAVIAAVAHVASLVAFILLIQRNNRMRRLLGT